MKKSLIICLPLVLLLFVGCGKNSTQKPTTSETIEVTTSETSSSVIESIEMTSTSSTTSKESTTKGTESSETTAASTTPSSTSEEGTKPSSSEEVVDANAELVQLFPTVAFPTEVPHTNKALNIAVAGPEEKLSVLYFDMNHPLILNKKELNYETPIAQYQQEAFASTQEAKEAVNLRVDMQGMKVDLGYGITGYQQGAAGSSYVAWQEGNWNLIVRASNIEQQDPVGLAKQVVEYLEQAMLPAPEEIGQITFDMVSDGYRSNEITWQVGNMVYTIRHQDPMAALRMAVSTLE
ncbi:hypothetical protein [Candidatus Enterococcus willemsii]|uniref:Lipoprotein n=1 Tax=Candidatus Enterococcus willemsii TaxID=1857215 RepID=A0ABQ6YYQ2_9ENTE|nr:hypothetical protein [Enterococcus sp. CU12B]KAF1303290.1 hypothetical protein BAU17_08675 [Enterococcus sp. CU12B]